MRRATLIAGIVTVVLMASPAVPAEALTVSTSDPTGDAATPANDITSVAVNYTESTVAVTVTVQGTLPPLSDSSWSTGGPGRGLAINFDIGATGNSNLYFDVSGSGAYAFDFETEQLLCTPSTSISGGSITVSAPSSCIKSPGSFGLTTAMGDFSGTTGIDYVPNSGLSSPLAVLRGGYWILGGDGGVFSFGDAKFYGSTGNLRLNAPVVGMAGMPNDDGYRFVATDGGVFNYGSAQHYGSRGGQPLNKPVVGMAATPSGNGYWLVASDGGIFSYGNAAFYGSTGSMALNKPIIGMASTPDGGGYWLVASDGGIFTFGNAAFYGSTGALRLDSPVVGMAVNKAGDGYWLATAAGEVFEFGGADFMGGLESDSASPVVGINAAEGDAYRLVHADGSVITHGSQVAFPDVTSLGISLNSAPVGMTTTGF